MMSALPSSLLPAEKELGSFGPHLPKHQEKCKIDLALAHLPPTSGTASGGSSFCLKSLILVKLFSQHMVLMKCYA